MSAREKAEVLDGAGLDRALTRIGHEIVEQAGVPISRWSASRRGETLAARDRSEDRDHRGQAARRRSA